MATAAQIASINTRQQQIANIQKSLATATGAKKATLEKSLASAQQRLAAIQPTATTAPKVVTPTGGGGTGTAVNNTISKLSTPKSNVGNVLSKRAM